jgi:hypothetical protein
MAKCPFCGSANTWPTSLDAGLMQFDDVKVSFWKPFTDVGVFLPVPQKATACVSCGHYWSTLDLAKVAQFVSTHACEEVKARMRLP